MKDFVAELSAQPAFDPTARFVRAVTPGAVKTNAGVLASIGSSRHRYPDAFFGAGNGVEMKCLSSWDSVYGVMNGLSNYASYASGLLQNELPGVSNVDLPLS